jgi:hypothetical protein
MDEIEIIDRLQEGKARSSHHAIRSRLLSMGDFLRDQQPQKIPIAPLVLFRASCQIAPRASRVR